MPPRATKQSMNICKLVFTFLFIENCHLSVVLQDLGWDTENAEHAQGLFFFFCIYLVDLLGNEGGICGRDA